MVFEGIVTEVKIAQSGRRYMKVAYNVASALVPGGHVVREVNAFEDSLDDTAVDKHAFWASATGPRVQFRKQATNDIVVKYALKPPARPTIYTRQKQVQLGPLTATCQCCDRQRAPNTANADRGGSRRGSAGARHTCQ